MENIEQEIWKDVIGYEELYQASTMGRIKSLHKIGGASRQSFTGIMKPKTNRGGYYVIHICKNGIAKETTVHKVIALTFLTNPYNLSTVNHKNGIKTDNRLENLEWCSIQDNLKHALETGLRKCDGENNGRSVFNKDDIIKAKLMYNTGKYSVREVRDMIGKGTRGSLQRAISGDTWKSIQ